MHDWEPSYAEHPLETEDPPDTDRETFLASLTDPADLVWVRTPGGRFAELWDSAENVLLRTAIVDCEAFTAALHKRFSSQRLVAGHRVRVSPWRITKGRRVVADAIADCGGSSPASRETLAVVSTFGRWATVQFRGWRDDPEILQGEHHRGRWSFSRWFTYDMRRGEVAELGDLTAATIDAGTAEDPAFGFVGYDDAGHANVLVDLDIAFGSNLSRLSYAKRLEVPVRRPVQAALARAAREGTLLSVDEAALLGE